MINPKINAPISAFVTIPMSEDKKGIPVIMLNATNRLAPELIPKTYGPANGLLNSVCINKPETANPPPDRSAIAIRGILISRAMSCSVTFLSNRKRPFQKSSKPTSITPADRCIQQTKGSKINALSRIKRCFLATIKVVFFDKNEGCQKDSILDGKCVIDLRAPSAALRHFAPKIYFLRACSNTCSS